MFVMKFEGSTWVEIFNQGRFQNMWISDEEMVNTLKVNLETLVFICKKKEARTETE